MVNIIKILKSKANFLFNWKKIGDILTKVRYMARMPTISTTI